MSRKLHLIALAVAVTGVIAPVAHADTAASTPTKVDPLAVSYLLGQGYSPAQVEAWTVGPCSRETKAVACFGPSRGAGLVSSTAKVDPLAVSYLLGQGLSPAQVEAWTVGECSHEVKPASCFQAFTSKVDAETVTSGGFDWRDAGIGAGATIGLFLLVGGLGAGLLISRQSRRRYLRGA
jgi:hypothetical protein